MSKSASGADASSGAIAGSSDRYYKRDFWSEENLKFAKPHYRLQKAARIVNRIAGRGECSLLDVGCGPAALQPLLRPGIRYHGIDIAIQEPAANLLEGDFLESPIGFGGQTFDLVIAQGFFEYAGKFQEQKFSEIAAILNGGGKFIVTYVNFGHRDREIYWPYSNVQPLADFRQGLLARFDIDQSFPTSHNWTHAEPRRRLVKAGNMLISMNIPVISPLLAVEYFFICSPRSRRDAGRSAV
jgi:SAM-dependent methyltransferase